MPPQHFVMKLTLHEHFYANKKGILKAKSGVIILTLSDLAADLQPCDFHCVNVHSQPKNLVKLQYNYSEEFKNYFETAVTSIQFQTQQPCKSHKQARI